MLSLSLPQFRLLSQARKLRTYEQRRWDLFIASTGVQSEGQGEALQAMMEQLTDDEAAVRTGSVPGNARYNSEGEAHYARTIPLLHEITPAQARSGSLRRIVHFVEVSD